MRPSKFRFPDRTAATTSLFASTASAIGWGNGPEFPMQVVHPKPTTLKRSRWSDSITPAFLKESVRTFDPGARLVFTQGLELSPFATAFRASSPAASMTLGFEVLVQLVIAAITTDP